MLDGGGGRRGGGGRTIIGGFVLSTGARVPEGTRDRLVPSSITDEIVDSIDCRRSEWEVRGRTPNVAEESRKAVDEIEAFAGNVEVFPADDGDATYWNC